MTPVTRPNAHDGLPVLPVFKPSNLPFPVCAICDSTRVCRRGWYGTSHTRYTIEYILVGCLTDAGCVQTTLPVSRLAAGRAPLTLSFAWGYLFVG